jgi:hypothetical protein
MSKGKIQRLFFYRPQSPYSASRCCYGCMTAETSAGEEWEQLEIIPHNCTMLDNWVMLLAQVVSE